MTGEQTRTQTAYLGSVRFFRHLILTVLCLMIAVPCTLTVLLLIQNGNLRAAAVTLPPEPVPLLARRR